MKLIYYITPPCSKCPYTLGLVNTITNPCLQCKDSGYETYEKLKKFVTGNTSVLEKWVRK